MKPENEPVFDKACEDCVWLTSHNADCKVNAAFSFLPSQFEFLPHRASPVSFICTFLRCQGPVNSSRGKTGFFSSQVRRVISDTCTLPPPHSPLLLQGFNPSVYYLFCSEDVALTATTRQALDVTAALQLLMKHVMYIHHTSEPLSILWHRGVRRLPSGKRVAKPQ